MTEEEMKQALSEERKKRADICSKELQELLEKHNCALDVATVIRSGQAPVMQIEILAK
jgi:hypothetical protein